MATGLGTNADIADYLAALLSDEGSLDTRFNTRISQSNTEAEQHIYAELVKRNYSPSQIATWGLLNETHIELAAMYVLRTIRARLTNPQIEILDQTLEKIQARLTVSLPLTTAYATIDSAEHDDNHLPRNTQGPGDDADENNRTFQGADSIPGF